jgi:transposase
VALHPPPIGVHRLLLAGLALPMPLPFLLPFRNVTAHPITLHPFDHRARVIPLVSHHLFDASDVHLEVCMFLRELLRHLRGPVIVLLDNASTHKGAPIEQLLRQHRRLRIEHFPSYAPQLNPDEGVWSLAKRELANSCPNDVDELMEDILGSIEGIRNSPQKLRGCIAQSDLPFSLR